MILKVKNCPWCQLDEIKEIENWAGHHILCESCGATSPVTKQRNVCVKVWNALSDIVFMGVTLNKVSRDMLGGLIKSKT